MSKLTITLIDVGWGDSIFLESEDSKKNSYFGLIDSNDTTTLRSSFIFLEKHFERMHPAQLSKEHVFDFIILSHSHLDHGQGLKAIMRSFGTANFWYPKSLDGSSLKELMRIHTLFPQPFYTFSTLRDCQSDNLGIAKSGTCDQCILNM